MNDIVLTFDVDWAPDFAIDFVAEQLVKHRIRATWFVTHDSPAIERLRRYPELFELGIHPNFLPGSTHGATTEEVLRHCMTLVPEAVSLRTHCLFQSTPLLCEVLSRTPITVDASLYLPHTPALSPIEYQWSGHTLLRVPHFWEDDFEIERFKPIWQLESLLKNGNGLKVFDFHPIHVYLNSRTMQPYELLKASVPRLSEAEQNKAQVLVQTGEGARDLFMQVVKHLSETGESLRIHDIEERWQTSREKQRVSAADRKAD